MKALQLTRTHGTDTVTVAEKLTEWGQKTGRIATRPLSLAKPKAVRAREKSGKPSNKSGQTPRKRSITKSEPSSFAPAQKTAKTGTDTRKGATHKTDRRASPYRVTEAAAFLYNTFNRIAHECAGKEMEGTFPYSTDAKQQTNLYLQTFMRMFLDPSARAVMQRDILESKTVKKLLHLPLTDQKATETAWLEECLQDSWKDLSEKLPTQAHWDKAAMRTLQHIENSNHNAMIEQSNKGTVPPSPYLHLSKSEYALKKEKLTYQGTCILDTQLNHHDVEPELVALNTAECDRLSAAFKLSLFTGGEQPREDRCTQSRTAQRARIGSQEGHPPATPKGRGRVAVYTTDESEESSDESQIKDDNQPSPQLFPSGSEAEEEEGEEGKPPPLPLLQQTTKSLTHSLQDNDMVIRKNQQP